MKEQLLLDEFSFFYKVKPLMNLLSLMELILFFELSSGLAGSL